MNFGVALAGDGGAESEGNGCGTDGRSVTASPLPAVPAAGRDCARICRPRSSRPCRRGFRPLWRGVWSRSKQGESLALPGPGRASLRPLRRGDADRGAPGADRRTGRRCSTIRPPLRLAWNGSLAGLLDRVASLSGYDWSWETLVPETLGPETHVLETLAPEEGAVVFHRFWDVAQRRPGVGRRNGRAPDAPEAVEWRLDGRSGGGRHPAAACSRAGPPAPAGPWSGTRSAITAWARTAVFEGGFLEAVDLLLSGPATRRTLEAYARTAANRHLVVDDADGAGW